MAVCRVLTNIFGKKTVLAYVTSADKETGGRRLYFSTVFPEQLQIFCAQQEKSPLNQTGSNHMPIHPFDTLCFSLEHRSKLLRTENVLGIMLLYGTQS